MRMKWAPCSRSWPLPARTCPPSRASPKGCAVIIVESLERLNGVSHAFFTRQGGVSAGVYASLNCGPGSNDDIDDVTTNRTRALAGMGLAGACLLTADQIHSSTVITADRPWGKKGAPKADGIVTKIPRIALGVLTA